MRKTRDKEFWQKLFEKRVPGYRTVFVKKRPWLKWVMLIFVLALPSYVIWAWYHYGDLTDDARQPLDFERLRKKDFNMASYVYDIKGRQMGRFFYEARDYAKLEDIPEMVRSAFLAAEDQNFYQYHFDSVGVVLNFGHFGIDPIAIGRASFFNTIHKYTGYYMKSGGSTVNQQLVRQLYEKDIADFRNRAPTFPRKIREARIAVKLDGLYSKDDILEGFLNFPYLGHGANGVVEAWRVYFSKDLRREHPTIREVAIAAALNKSPEKFCPIYHPPEKPGIPKNADEKTRAALEQEYEIKDAKEKARLFKARERWNYVIERLYDNGYISREDYEKEKFKEDEPFKLEIIRLNPIKKKHFVYANRMIKEFLIFNGMSDEEITKAGAKRIESTIDLDIQRILSEEMNKQLADLNKELPESDLIEGSFIALDVKTGEIRAASGGHEDLSEKQYNRLLARRSPGSAIKPFVYAAALEEGGGLDDPICNCPIRMRGASGKIWAPQNFREENPVPTGKIPRAIGFIRSVNLPTIQMIREVEDGEEKFVELANRCGIWGNRNVLKDSDGRIWFRYISSAEEKSANNPEGNLEPRLTSVIGGFGVSLIELAAGYGPFARGGTYIKPTLIREVKNYDGSTWKNFVRPEERRVMSEETARNITVLGRAVTKFGTLKISMRGIEQQIAGKTGTSNSAGLNIYGQPSEGPADVLVVTWNPEFIIAIRFGHDKLRSIEVPQYMKRVSGQSSMQVTGGWLAGLVARRAWDRIYKDRPKVAFPEDVEIGTSELVEKYSSKY
ncbi:MAG: transglycosylase domain-containing protein [Candidatus Yanofskybacteria bacterium]|nr:transglycosylase domain-containing protein [Candidatus Yanofskybacteria bacterium]